MNNILQCMNMKRSKLKNKIYNMKNLEKILMLITFVLLLISTVISIKLGESWYWQAITMLWVVVAYMKLRLSERQEKIIEKLTK